MTPVVKEKHYPIVCIFGSFKVWRLSGRLKEDTLGLPLPF